MARCTKCGITLYRVERSNITMDREVKCGWKHKDCSKAVGKKELEKPSVKPVAPVKDIQGAKSLPLGKRKEVVGGDKKHTTDASDENLKDKKSE